MKIHYFYFFYNIQCNRGDINFFKYINIGT